MYHITMLAVPHLVKTKGNIVNVSSVTGIRSVSTNVIADTPPTSSFLLLLAHLSQKAQGELLGSYSMMSVIRQQFALNIYPDSPPKPRGRLSTNFQSCSKNSIPCRILVAMTTLKIFLVKKTPFGFHIMATSKIFLVKNYWSIWSKWAWPSTKVVQIILIG